MKKNIYRFFWSFSLLSMIFGTFANAFANEELKRQLSIAKDTTVLGLPLSNISLKRNDALMTVTLDMKFRDYKLHGDRVSIFTPFLKNGEDSVEFTKVGIYSRIRYIQYLREEEQPIGGDAEVSYPYSKRPAYYDMDKSVTYRDWMNGSTLYLKRSDFGCCNSLIDEEIVPIGKWKESAYTPQYIYFTDIQAETVKIREITGRAYVDFPVNKIVIYPEYRNNTYELGKIIATIDSVKNDPDITVTNLHIAGTASPEGPYDNNVYLAKNRTIALKEYVRNLYNFPESFITTSFEPVDWAGLREWLENNNLEYKHEILNIVNSDIEPYARNSKIRKDFPKQYDWLLKNVYPALRHSDYRIEFTIRQFSDVNEIREILKEAPQKLSLNEIYLLVKSLEPGSQEYDEVFETAVLLFPHDATANLNAANAAMRKNNMEKAEKYLREAGNSNEAQYARAILAAKNGRYEEAMEIFGSLSGSMPEAADAYKNISEILTVE